MQLSYLTSVNCHELPTIKQKEARNVSESFSLGQLWLQLRGSDLKCRIEIKVRNLIENVTKIIWSCFRPSEAHYTNIALVQIHFDNVCRLRTPTARPNSEYCQRYCVGLPLYTIFRAVRLNIPVNFFAAGHADVIRS